MAGRKYKPALFELVNKGRVKPDKKGALIAPRWIYKQNEGPEQVLQTGARVVSPPAPLAQRQEQSAPQTAAPQTISPKAPAATTIGADTTAAARAAAPAAKATTAAAPAVRYWGLDWGQGRVQLWARWWVAALIVGGLLLGLLAAYRLGEYVGHRSRNAQAEPDQTSSGPPAADTRNLQPSEALQRIVDGPVRRDILNPPANTAAAAPNPAGAALAGSGRTPPPSTDRTALAARPAGALCLILCGSDQRRDLIDVQEYFSTQGVLTRIGRFQNRYVLYTDRGVDSRSGAEALEFHQQIAQLGGGYNRQKPAAAASFPASTFKTAYWVKRDDILKND
ncbi:MAG: hypothetical protein JW810_10900 [Sedimentisphaerales bacterium]|nr:hypothetical protein [Sedimentisphaerales bacterium]